MNTLEGGKKVARTIKERYGEDYYVKMGRIGGAKKSQSKGFGSNRELASIAGARGGKASKRRSKKQ